MATKEQIINEYLIGGISFRVLGLRRLYHKTDKDLFGTSSPRAADLLGGKYHPPSTQTKRYQQRIERYRKDNEHAENCKYNNGQ